MDVQFFLERRLAFIRRYHSTAIAPFQEIVRKIEAGEEPYKALNSYSDDGEPAFQEEWEDAQDAINVTGQGSVSILSESLKLYFETQMAMHRWELTKAEKTACKNSGFVNGYRLAFERLLDFNFSDSQADLSVIEQTVMARNASRHPKWIASMTINHAGAHDRFRRNLFFIRDNERASLKGEASLLFLLPPRIHVSEENLSAAIDEVEKLTRWLDARLQPANYAL